MQREAVLTTRRLILRPLETGDAFQVQTLAGAREIAANTLNIPHPYEDGEAERWIASQREACDRGDQSNFAILVRTHSMLIGVIGLVIDQANEHAELGYWIGKPYWNKGYCTEAALAVLAHGFNTLALNRIYADHFTRNPASGRILQKIGMRHEGCSRQHVKKWDVFVDVEKYGMLREEFDQKRAGPQTPPQS